MNRPDAPDDLAGLPRALDPPGDLEERVFTALRERRLVRRERPARALSRWGLAAACLLAALFGWTARGLVQAPVLGPIERPPGAQGTTAAGREYLLLLLEPLPLRTSRPLDSLIAEYRAWAEELVAQGRLVAAGRLESGGRYLPASGRSGAPGVAAASGFFVVRAAGLAEAERVAATCPHLRYGGEISVRELSETSPPPKS